jgi:hypothetical protein
MAAEEAAAEAICKWLLKKKVDANLQDSCGNTPFASACAAGSLVFIQVTEFVTMRCVSFSSLQQYLLAISGGLKADPYKPNFKGKTSIHFLARNVKNDPEIQKVLSSPDMFIRLISSTRFLCSCVTPIRVLRFCGHLEENIPSTLPRGGIISTPSTTSSTLAVSHSLPLSLSLFEVLPLSLSLSFSLLSFLNLFFSLGYLQASTWMCRHTRDSRVFTSRRRRIAHVKRRSC